MDTKRRSLLLTEWAHNVLEAANLGQLGAKVRLSRIETISGPRTAALDIFAGFDAGTLLRAVNKSDAANARQLVPWNFDGRVIGYMNGKAVRMEAPWSEDLMLKNFSIHDKFKPLFPHGTGRWLAGINLMGGIVTLGFTSFTPHYLIAGTTGSGKSVAIRSAAYQLSTFSENKLVFIDGKMGEGLSLCGGLPNQLGPLVTNADLPECLEVMSWLVATMNDRYRQIIALREARAPEDEIVQQLGRIIIFIDEVQELIKGIDQFTELLRKLSTQARAAYMHLVLSTQHPTAEIFEDPSIKATLLGRVVLKVSHAEASRSALGHSWPRADFLLGQGDSYCRTASSSTQRVQIGYISDELFADAKETLAEHPPVFDSWPSLADTLGEEFSSSSGFDPQLLAIALAGRSGNEGRVKLNRRLEQAGIPELGKTRMRGLIRDAERLIELLNQQGFRLLPDESATHGPE